MHALFNTSACRQFYKKNIVTLASYLYVLILAAYVLLQCYIGYACLYNSLRLFILILTLLCPMLIYMYHFSLPILLYNFSNLYFRYTCHYLLHSSAYRIPRLPYLVFLCIHVPIAIEESICFKRKIWWFSVTTFLLYM